MPLESAGMKRRPLTSTSVRVLPKPRRLAVSTPDPPPLLTVEVLPDASCGISFRVFSSVTLPDSFTSSLPMTEIGLGAVRSVRTSRDPVTTISVEGWAASWAWAVEPKPPPARMVDSNSKALRRPYRPAGRIVIISLSPCNR